MNKTKNFLIAQYNMPKFKITLIALFSDFISFYCIFFKNNCFIIIFIAKLLDLI